jgi:transposase-like protein
MTRPDSIRAQGLRTYLNATVHEHKGRGYVSFVQMIDDKASINYMARAFHVSKNTMQKWVKIHSEELLAKIT